MLVIRSAADDGRGTYLYRMLVDGICVAVLVRSDESPIRIWYAGTRIITPLTCDMLSRSFPSVLRSDHVPTLGRECIPIVVALVHHAHMLRAALSSLVRLFPSIDSLRRSPPSPFRSTPSFPPLEILLHPLPAVALDAV